MTSKTYACCIDVDNFVRQTPFPEGYQRLLRIDGVPLTAVEARTYFVMEKAKGHKVIPTSFRCKNPCDGEGCRGFDYSGGGCDGRES